MVEMDGSHAHQICRTIKDPILLKDEVLFNLPCAGYLPQTLLTSVVFKQTLNTFVNALNFIAFKYCKNNMYILQE